jgi:hypothetical protein
MQQKITHLGDAAPAHYCHHVNKRPAVERMMKGWLYETHDLVDRWSKGIRRRRLCRDTGFHAVVCSHGSAYHDVF